MWVPHSAERVKYYSLEHLIILYGKKVVQRSRNQEERPVGTVCHEQRRVGTNAVTSRAFVRVQMTRNMSDRKARTVIKNDIVLPV